MALVALTAPPATAAENPPSSGHSFTRTIYLIRHGAYDMTEKGDESVVNGLTPLGIAQARLIATRLRGMPIKFASLTSSTYTRARQTAGIIGQMFPDLALHTDPVLCECTPRTWRTDVIKDVPKEELDASDAQINQAFAKYFVPTKTVDENDIIVAHGDLIRALICKALGVDTKAWLGFNIAHCSLTVVQVKADGTFKVLAVGDTGHIPPNLLSGLTATNPELVTPKSP